MSIAKQHVPHMDFDAFSLGQISDLFLSGEIFINKEYQRGDIWTKEQQQELIRSIVNCYSIGVLVLFINEGKQCEILDGQQRLLSIRKYVEGTIDLRDTDLTPYAELERTRKDHINAYHVCYLRLKGLDGSNKEEDIVQTFLRLQEGTPLNRAEKISAHRGLYKDTFRQMRDEHKLFELMGPDRRFRLRLLAAEMLLVELETNFQKLFFPGLDLKNHLVILKKYESAISRSKIRSYRGNIDILFESLNYLLSGMSENNVLMHYILVSYLRKYRAGNENLIEELAVFSKEFLKILNSFSMYDPNPPSGMDPDLFNKYLNYKLQGKMMTTSESLENRIKIMLDEFERIIGDVVKKDPQRFFDEEQKRILYFRQEGLCSKCGKPMLFRGATADHVVAHGQGGKSDIKNAQLLHNKCHKSLNTSKKKKSKTVRLENRLSLG